jgi:hypothetical protein
MSSAGASNAGFAQRPVLSTKLMKVEQAQSLRGLGFRRLGVVAIVFVV